MKRRQPLWPPDTPATFAEVLTGQAPMTLHACRCLVREILQEPHVTCRCLEPPTLEELVTASWADER